MKSLKLLILLLLFLLNNKVMATVFYVTNNNNSGVGSLREAIINANANGIVDQDFIYFNISANGVDDVTINLNSELPALTSNIAIDATTQPTSFLGNNSIRIRLVRTSSEFFNGLVLLNASKIAVYGLYFSNFLSENGVASDDRKAGIYLRNTEDIIIGAPNKQNGFGNNYTSIISPTSLNFQKNIAISSNIIGLDATGEIAAPNAFAIDLSYLNNSVIGGATDAHGNLISSNDEGVYFGAASGSFQILNNKVGFNASKTKVFLKDKAVGIYVSGETADVLVADNYIAAQGVGLKIYNVKKPYQIKHNFFGIGFNGENFGNKKYGIELYTTAAGVIGGDNIADQNVIAYNDLGIQIDNCYPVSVLKNSIYCNTKGAIVFKDFPDGKTITQSKIDIVGSNFASGLYLPNSKVELFIDDECPDCQGKIWVATLPTNTDGSWSYSGPIAGGLTSTGTNSDGATSTFSKAVIVENNVKINHVYCGTKNGSIKNLDISDASIFEWYNDQNEIIATSRDLENVGAGKYYLKVRQPGACEARSSIFIVENIVLDFKVKVIESIPESCNSANGSINVKTWETAVPNIFTWKDKDGLVVGSTATLKNVSAGTYELSASNGLGCENVVGKFNVPYAALPSLNISQLKSSISCDGKSISVRDIKIESDNGPFKYNWIDESNKTIATVLNFQGLVPGKYYLKASDRYGCETFTDFIDFTSLKNEVLNVPNSFTPNNDGVNDLWSIAGSENYPLAEYSIYNRNGERVFFSKGYTNKFDGTFNGSSLNAGIYYYYIDLKNTCGKLSGNVTILR